MFANHQLLLSLKMAMIFDINDGLLSQNEISFFINGNKYFNETVHSPISWISDKVWYR